MTWRFLLDTNVLSEQFRPAPNPGIMEGLRRHDGQCATAAPVWHEMVLGCCLLPPTRKRSAIEKFLFGVAAITLPILEYGAAAAEWHARERARLARAGVPPPFVDGQIAAIARINSLEIITSNVKHYQAFEGVRVRDWWS